MLYLNIFEEKTIKTLKKTQLTTTLLLSALCAPSAFAVDGVIEINQTCAITGGCFAGDSAGFPVTITDTAGGSSFRLTSDLVQPKNTNNHSIDITASDISIDLNGFSIRNADCVGSTNCTPASGLGDGVSSQNPGTSVKNGSITGMTSGANLSSQSEALNLRVRWNRSQGIEVGRGSTISGNTAYQNGLNGVNAGYDATIMGNTARGNGNNGITAGSGATIMGNTARENGKHGITSGEGGTVNDNTLFANAEYGFHSFSPTPAYRNNTINNNVGGTVLGGINLGGNSCNGTVTCP